MVVPGQPANSLLWQRVAAAEMPPDDPLPEDEKQVLRNWIAGGAVWGTGPVDPWRFTSAHRAGYDWWALQAPVTSPPLWHHAMALDERPTAVSGLIDVFVRNKIHQRRLRGSPPASRRTLIRRMSFGLLGLPPRPSQVDAFVADPSPNAHQRLADRLLASPHFGERWTRHWLDVVRFAESQGFERDKLRDGAWRYRDWVIDAMNRDLPYDRFARLQLAGDVYHPDDPSAIIATGFLVAGPWDEVGSTQQSAAMRAVVREDELEESISAVGQTFLGLTVNCARCHDHKFDPIKQAEYYQLASALDGVRHGTRKAFDKRMESAAWHAVSAINSRMEKIENYLAALEQPVRERVLADQVKVLESVHPPAPVARWEFDRDFRDSLGELHGEPHANARLEDGKLLLDGKSFVVTAPLTFDLTGKMLEAWVTLADLGQRHGGIMTVTTLHGNMFDAFVYASTAANRWMAFSEDFQRTHDFAGMEESHADGETVHFAIVYQKDGTIRGYRNGQPYGRQDGVGYVPGTTSTLPFCTS